MPNPYAIIGGLVGLILLVTGAFFYGQHLGYQSRQAEEASTLGKEYAGYVTASGDAAKKGTAAALKDFQDKAAVLSAGSFAKAAAATRLRAPKRRRADFMVFLL